MGKTTKIVYECDRCGKNITGFPFSIGRFRYMHIFKWWSPMPINNYKMKYLCQGCFNSFKEWYGEKLKNEEEENRKDAEGLLSFMQDTTSV